MISDTLQARYDRQLATTLRFGEWLAGPGGRRLPCDTWEVLFGRYQEHLAELRRLGYELRPAALRVEPLPGDRLVGEVLALFGETD